MENFNSGNAPLLYSNIKKPKSKCHYTNATNACHTYDFYHIPSADYDKNPDNGPSKHKLRRLEIESELLKKYKTETNKNVIIMYLILFIISLVFLRIL